MRPKTTSEELADIVREAHGVCKDLRGLIRQGEAVVQAIQVAAHVSVDQRIAAEIERGLAQYTKDIKAAIDKGKADVFERFAALCDDVLSDTATGLDGMPSFEELARAQATLKRARKAAEDELPRLMSELSWPSPRRTR